MAFFFRSKGISRLADPQDRAWASNISSAAADMHLEMSAANNAVPRVNFLLDQFEFTRDQLQLAVMAAIRAGSVDSLDAIIRKTPAKLILRASEHSSKSLLKNMLEAAAEKKDIKVWSYLQDRYGFSNGSWLDAEPSAYDYLKIAAKHAWHAAAEKVFPFLMNEDGSYYGGVLEVFADKKDEDLQFALRWADKFKNKPHNLTRALYVVVKKGDESKVDILVKAGVNLNADSGKAFRLAILNDHTAMIDHLIKQGGRPDLFGAEVLAALSDEEQKKSSARHFQAIVDSFCPPVKNETDDRFFLAAPDTVGEKQSLPGGGSLTVLFNFTSRQQIMVAQAPGRVPSTPAIVNFDDIENPLAVARAKERLLALGGHAADMQEETFRSVRRLSSVPEGPR